MKNCFTFYFSFYDENLSDEQNETNCVFSFIPLNITELTDKQESQILKSCNDHNLEHHSYGIHDVSFGEVFTNNGETYEGIFGFSTYEVEPDKVDDLMNIWKNILSSEVGIETGDIFKMTGEEYNNSIL